MFHRSLALVVCVALLPLTARADRLPVVHASNGLAANAAPFGFQRGSPRPSGPRAEASGMTAPAAIESFPGLQGVVTTDPKGVTRPRSLLQRVLPPYQLEKAHCTIPDTYDLLFFTDAKLVRVRVHLKVAGNPLDQLWKSRLKSYFDFLDRDGDGRLNAYEIDFAFSNRAMQQLLQSGFASPNPREPPRTVADFDLDNSGAVSFDELVAYYQPTTQSLIRSQVNNFDTDATGAFLTDSLFQLFDRDKDGKLSKAELGQLERLLASYDQNEDECLTSQELVPNQFGVRPNPQPRAVDQSIQVFAVGAIPDSILEQILTRYDKDKNLRLTKSENPFDDATFTSLDKNNNQEVTVTELVGWMKQAPDLSIEMTLGEKPTENQVKALLGPDGKPTALGQRVKSPDAGRAIIPIGTQSIDVTCPVPANAATPQQRRVQFAFYFTMADTVTKGYFTEKDIAGPQFQFIRVLFDVMDRDSDGRVTRLEFDRYFDVQASFMDLPLLLLHNTRTPNLFQLLDANSDGRLSVPELRDSWNRLKDMEPTPGEFVTRAAIQPQGRLRFGRTITNFQFNQGGVFNPGTMPVQTKGPLWFRKMDRNADGVISSNEFPGATPDFAKLDTNRDGLIDLDEAEAAEKRLRPEKK